MTNDQKKIITATVPVLRENGVVLTTHFYNRMFKHHPDLKNMFNMGNQQSGKQQKALAMAVLAYAEHISNPGVLLPELDRIGHKHTSLDIRPEHYPIVGNHLLASIQEVLGEAATPEILDAWEAAYDQLANLMVGIEGDMYKSQTAKPNGWTGWRPFKVGKKSKESAEITSFYLYPADGGKVVPHLPGQFVSLRVFLPELNLNQARQYSLSNAPNEEYYRISVKREPGVDLNTNGLISNHLHDQVVEGDLVNLTCPTGNFVLTQDLQAPITLISGGVGLTPLMSMLHNLVENNHEHPITWLHACRSGSVHAFQEEVRHLMDAQPNIKHHIFYDTLNELDREKGIVEGPLSLSKIDSINHESNTHYFICGPSGFIKKQYQDLVEKGVDKNRIYFEEFGPALLGLN
jgi:nitric oxide dioxygenase